MSSSTLSEVDQRSLCGSLDTIRSGIRVVKTWSHPKTKGRGGGGGGGCPSRRG